MNREQRREWRRDIQRRKRKGKVMLEYEHDNDPVEPYAPVDPLYWLADEATEESQDEIPPDDTPDHVNGDASSEAGSGDGE